MIKAIMISSIAYLAASAGAFLQQQPEIPSDCQSLTTYNTCFFAVGCHWSENKCSLDQCRLRKLDECNKDQKCTNVYGKCVPQPCKIVNQSSFKMQGICDSKFCNWNQSTKTCSASPCSRNVQASCPLNSSCKWDEQTGCIRK